LENPAVPASNSWKNPVRKNHELFGCILKINRYFRRSFSSARRSGSSFFVAFFADMVLALVQEVHMKLLSSLLFVMGVVCLPLAASAQVTNATTPQISARAAGEKLVDAIILVESQGRADRVGSLGERGLMQIRLATWREVSRKVFGRPLPFAKAFDGTLNRRVGSAYLAQLQTQIGQHRTEWQADERSLLIAAYNAGPTLLAQKNFDLKKVPASTRDYVERVTNLHDAMLAELARAAQQRQLLQQIAQRYSSPRVASL
jgi:hypothetical protein